MSGGEGAGGDRRQLVGDRNSGIADPGTDADAVFGMIYAQAEDDCPRRRDKAKAALGPRFDLRTFDDRWCWEATCR